VDKVATKVLQDSFEKCKEETLASGKRLSCQKVLEAVPHIKQEMSSITAKFVNLYFE